MGELTTEARSKSTTPERLRYLATREGCRALAARNPRTPADVLHSLSDFVDQKVDRGLARNRSTTVPTLLALATDERPHKIHKALLKRSGLDVAVLTTLARSQNITTLTLLLAREHLDEATLKELVQHAPENIAVTVARREDATAEVLALLMKFDDQSVRCNIAEHEDATPELLARLATDTDFVVRQRVAKANTIGAETMQLLEHDPIETVRHLLVFNTAVPQTSLQRVAVADPDPTIRCSAAKKLTGELPARISNTLARSPDPRIRTIAGSQAHSAIHLLADPDPTVRSSALKLARFPPGIALKAMADRDPSVVYYLLKNQNGKFGRRALKAALQLADPSLRRLAASRIPEGAARLFKMAAEDPDPWVRLQVTWREDAPKSLLRTMTDDEDDRVRNNARVRVGDVSEKPLRAIAEARSNSTAPDRLLQLARSESLDTRRALARNKALPMQVHWELAKLADCDVRKLLGKMPHVPPEVLAFLAEQNDYGCRFAVSQNPNLPDSVRRKLLDDPCFEVRRAIAQHTGLEDHEAQQLAGDAAFLVRQAVAKRSGAPAAVLRVLANDPDSITRSNVAAHRRTDGETLATYHKEPCANVAVIAAKRHKKLTKAGLHTFASHPSFLVGLALLEDKRLSTSDVELLAQRPVMRRLATDHKHASPELLESLIDDGHWYTRKRVVQRSAETELAITLTVARDRSYTVRKAVASLPTVPPETLMVMAGDQDPHIRWLVARHAGAPAQALDLLVARATDTSDLVTDQEVSAMLAVASNPNAAPATLDRLAASPWAWVRAAAARNPNLPVATLDQMSADSGSAVRQAVASQERTSPATLVDLARDLDCMFAVAKNPAAPPAALIKLSNKGDQHVRRALASNPSTPTTVLDRLAFDDDERVRRALATNPNISDEERVLAALF